MADYRENVNRIVSVGWPSGVEVKYWQTELAIGIGDYWTGISLDTPAADVQEFHDQFTAGKKVIVGTVSETRFDFSLVPGLGPGESLSNDSQQPMANLPVYNELGNVITKADRPAFGSRKILSGFVGSMIGLDKYSAYDYSTTLTFTFVGPIALEAEFFLSVNNNFGTDPEFHSYFASSDAGDTATTCATGLKDAINTGSVFNASSSGAVVTFEPASEEGGRFSFGIINKDGDGTSAMSIPAFNGTTTASAIEPGFLWSGFFGTGGELMRLETPPT